VLLRYITSTTARYRLRPTVHLSKTLIDVLDPTFLAIRLITFQMSVLKHYWTASITIHYLVNGQFTSHCRTEFPKLVWSNRCKNVVARIRSDSGVTGRGDGGPPRWHHPGGWHPNEYFVGEFTRTLDQRSGHHIFVVKVTPSASALCDTDLSDATADQSCRKGL